MSAASPEPSTSKARRRSSSTLRVDLRLHAPDRVLDVLYIQHEAIGQGGFGITYGAQRRDSAALVAIKALPKTPLSVREVHLWRTISGIDGILPLRAVYEDDEFIYVEAERCQVDLRQLVRAPPPMFIICPGLGKRLTSGHAHLCSYSFWNGRKAVIMCNGRASGKRRPVIVVVSGIARPPTSCTASLLPFKICTAEVSPGPSPVGAAGSISSNGATLLCTNHDRHCLTPAYRPLMWSLGVLLHRCILGQTPFPARDHFHEQLYVVRDWSWDPALPCYSKVDARALDLLGRLLEKDTARRITAAEVLLHPWVVDGPINASEGISILDLMRDFIDERAEASPSPTHQTPISSPSPLSEATDDEVGVTPLRDHLTRASLQPSRHRTSSAHPAIGRRGLNRPSPPPALPRRSGGSLATSASSASPPGARGSHSRFDAGGTRVRSTSHSHVTQVDTHTQVVNRLRHRRASAANVHRHDILAEGRTHHRSPPHRESDHISSVQADGREVPLRPTRREPYLRQRVPTTPIRP
ncbi:uncharacterized protein MONBRDRAFT_39009 [Monosiga brevicollis MX1]|uniref:Protein kinase domain-containing protein n=1 Tax=Monosiga brevicollis TaxID=81824 RepID=A9VBL9_MONBE|nr:uncharacterized protein MONBRDRAFT_39009 [Monosiga brevicollis MX1]EDQ85086.1 predicted protein [Monosiga brevicollis MX1]|eukprot:XP_001750090.1 hypothetical protein [Monosiga brevicollis MX1]